MSPYYKTLLIPYFSTSVSNGDEYIVSNLLNHNEQLAQDEYLESENGQCRFQVNAQGQAIVSRMKSNRFVPVWMSGRQALAGTAPYSVALFGSKMHINDANNEYGTFGPNRTNPVTHVQLNSAACTLEIFDLKQKVWDTCEFMRFLKYFVNDNFSKT